MNLFYNKLLFYGGILIMKLIKKGKKKKGFTLIELIAVIAIIGILAAVLVPRVVGYINDAKRSEVVQQARQVLTAYETYNAKEDVSLDTATTFTELQAALNASPKGIDYTEFIDVTTIDKIHGDVDMAQCQQATDSDNIVDVTTIPWEGDFE